MKTKIEELKSARQAAWVEYDKLAGPCRSALQRYEAACAAYRDEELYEKAKRKAMRDLIAAAGRGDQ